MKTKQYFACLECGYLSTKWLGKCPECSEWNSFEKNQPSIEEKNCKIQKSIRLSDIPLCEYQRLITGHSEFDNLLGGGVVRGSLTLIGGEPGIGKSTLLLQLASRLSSYSNCLYVSGEESKTQIKMRSSRIGELINNINILTETNFEAIEESIRTEEFKIIIIDSIQTIYSSEISSPQGSIGQIKECTLKLMNLTKSENLTTFITGHITKDGMIAGPKMLEHMVDSVLYFEGEKNSEYRILRCSKNRFGSINEIGVFEMTEKGLIDLKNPSTIFCKSRSQNECGAAFSVILEGTRPIVAEVQSLITKTNYGAIPRRISSGLDQNRCNLILAVLEKTLGYHFANQDSYTNLTGGLKVTEPAIDIAIALSVTSSFKNIPLKKGVCSFGEIGLSGEIRKVKYTEKRIAEAAKFGLSTFIIPDDEYVFEKEVNTNIIKVKNIREAISAAI